MKGKTPGTVRRIETRVKKSCYLKTSRRDPQRPAAWSGCGLYMRGCGGNSRSSSSRLPWSSRTANVAFKTMYVPPNRKDGKNSARFWSGQLGFKCLTRGKKLVQVCSYLLLGRFLAEHPFFSPFM